MKIISRHIITYLFYTNLVSVHFLSVIQCAAMRDKEWDNWRDYNYWTEYEEGVPLLEPVSKYEVVQVVRAIVARGQGKESTAEHHMRFAVEGGMWYDPWMPMVD